MSQSEPTPTPQPDPSDQPDLDPDVPDFDLDDETLRRAGSIKWTHLTADVLPAWVAELDVAPCPVVTEALTEAIAEGRLGYPGLRADVTLKVTTARFLSDRFGLPFEPGRVIVTGDVMSAVIMTLSGLCRRAPVVIPVPTYPPFVQAVRWCGLEPVLVPMNEPTADTGWTLDLDRIDQALAAGAGTVLLANPHNPTGRCFSRDELEGLRDVVLKHGARVISDEIHAPLVLPDAVHIPYAALAGTADHVTTVVAASKAWNIPGLKCAQLIAGNDADLDALEAMPPVTNHGTSSLGVIASVAAYRDGRPWLDGLITHLDQRRRQLGELITAYLPQVSWAPSEATYLAWLDVRAADLPNPGAVALVRGNVMVNRGETFGPGYDGFVRLNYGTSAERLERVVKALATVWN